VKAVNKFAREGLLHVIADKMKGVRGLVAVISYIAVMLWYSIARKVY